VNHPQLEVERESEIRAQPTTVRRTPLVLHKWVRDALLFGLAAAVCFFLTRGTILFLHSPDRGLPYADHFANSENSEWTAYGGNWKVEDGSMVNESNERGAKLVAGSPYWTDYTIQADVALRSAGDAGIIARVSDAELGVDAYDGIYVGLRTRDQVLVIGAADHGWSEYAHRALSPPIVPNAWYRMRVRLEGCRVDAIVTQEDSTEMGRVSVTVDSCPVLGRIGLRSYDSGGIWKHVRVTKLVASD
jgi:hypothetical protein